MSNAFMESAARSRREQKAIEKAGVPTEETKVLNIRIPADLHRRAALHRVETGESVTKLVCRLLSEELED